MVSVPIAYRALVEMLNKWICDGKAKSFVLVRLKLESFRPLGHVAGAVMANLRDLTRSRDFIMSIHFSSSLFAKTA